MRLDEFKSRVNVVIEEAKRKFADYDVALREERRRYWLRLLDLFNDAVEQEEKKHRSEQLNPYRSRIAFAITAFGAALTLAPESDAAGRIFFKFGDDVAKEENLVVAVSPGEELEPLQGFEIKKYPKARRRDVDVDGRLLLTPAEFKSKIEGLKRLILSVEPPLPLPIEIRQAPQRKKGEEVIQVHPIAVYLE
jgi:hypothetical protein